MNIIDFACLMLVITILIIALIRNYINDKKKIQNNTEDRKIIKKENKDFFEKHYIIIWLVLVVILFFTVILRFGEIPAYIGVDEAGMAYDAFCLAEYGTDRYENSYPLYLTNFGQGQSSLCAY